MNLLEYLKCVLLDNQYLKWIADDSYYDKVLPEVLFVDELLLHEIISKFHQSDERNALWEAILSYLSPESISQSVFEYLMKNKIGIIALGHKDLDDKKLDTLANHVEEALFTLAKRFYKRDSYSCTDFCSFLKKHDHDMLLEQLLFETPNDPKKELILYYFYYRRDQSRITRLIKAKKLRITESTEEIENAYKLKDYLLNLAISSNLFTPDEILEELAKISEMKYASKIRSNIKETLKFKKILKM